MKFTRWPTGNIGIVEEQDGYPNPNPSTDLLVKKGLKEYTDLRDEYWDVNFQPESNFWNLYRVIIQSTQLKLLKTHLNVQR